MLRVSRNELQKSNNEKIEMASKLLATQTEINEMEAKLLVKMSEGNEIKAKLDEIDEVIRSHEKAISQQTAKLDQLRHISANRQEESTKEGLNELSMDGNHHHHQERKNECPICLESAKGKQIFSCQKCENWICGDCQASVSRACPLCRQSLRFNPFRRNRTMERHIN